MKTQNRRHHLTAVSLVTLLILVESKNLFIRKMAINQTAYFLRVVKIKIM